MEKLLLIGLVLSSLVGAGTVVTMMTCGGMGMIQRNYRGMEHDGCHMMDDEMHTLHEECEEHMEEACENQTCEECMEEVHNGCEENMHKCCEYKDTCGNDVAG